MRFRKGSKIEVLSKEEVPSGSWRCAEIIWGNGHNYDVKYEWSPGATGTAMTGRVSRKHIRPCPPPVGDAVDWVSGDLVEVLDNISWKMATVLRVMGGSYFLVKPLGSSQELRVHKSYLRVRQSWQHDKWVVVGKGSVVCEDGKSNKLSTSRFYKNPSCHVPATVLKVKRRVGDDFFPVENNIHYQESHMVSSRALKRESPYATSEVEANTGAGRKWRATEKDGRRQRMVSDHPSPLLEKLKDFHFEDTIDASPAFSRAKVGGFYTLLPKESLNSGSSALGGCLRGFIFESSTLLLHNIMSLTGSQAIIQYSSFLWKHSYCRSGCYTQSVSMDEKK